MSSRTKIITDKIPTAWPGAFGVYQYSKATVLSNIGTYLGLLALTFFASAVLGGIGGRDIHTGSYAFAQLLSMLASVYLSGAIIFVLLKSIDREKIGFSDIFAKVTRYFLPLLAVCILLYVILAVSLILFIIPFFIVLPRITLAPYFVVAENLDPFDAIKASWEKTRGHSSKVWGIIGATIVYMLLMLTIVGIPFAFYFLFMYSGAYAILFRWIQKNADS